MSGLPFSYHYEPAQKRVVWSRRPPRAGKHVFICKSNGVWKRRNEILAWCKANIGPIKKSFQFSPYAEPEVTIAFFNESDALMFRIQWVGELTEEKHEQRHLDG